MDIHSQEKFDKLVRSEPASWTSGDIEFMKARRSYLTHHDRERFADVLRESAEQAQEQAEAPAEQPAKPKKK